MGTAWLKLRAGRWSAALSSPIRSAMAGFCGALMLASCVHAPEGGSARLTHSSSAARPSAVKHRVAGTSRAIARPVRPAAATPIRAEDGPVGALPAATRTARPAPIPLPDKSLLERQSPPDCELKTEPAAPNDAEVKIKMLDHERRCYRQVETIVRGRLDKLQDAVDVTITAVESRTKAASPR